ncbi:MAG: RNA-binding domain-containing protein, partial [Methanoculleus sp.]
MKAKAIREILSLGEGPDIEFLPDCRNIGTIGPVVCGFLNTSGGYVVCGVDEQGRVAGIENPDATEKSLEQELQQALSPGALVPVQAHEVEGKALLVIEVPAGKDLPYAFENIIYLRTGETTRKADVETIRDMVLRKQVEPERWERRFSSADMSEDLDLAEIQSTLKEVAASKRFRFRDSSNPVAILEDLSVSRYGRLTNGGDLLFGTNPAVRYPQIRVRAMVSRVDRADDTYQDMKSFEGPLVPVLEDVYSFIVRNTRMTSQFRPGELRRRDEPLYPSGAIREGLVNAFAHRDYSDFSGGITIHIYPGRLEISNTGRFPEGVTPEKLKKGTLSVLRNPDIAHVLYLRGYMEKIGRG